jgi:hypothetical protein
VKLPPLALPLALLWPAAAPALGDGADGKFEKRTSSHFVLYQDVDIDETGGLYGSRRFEQQVLETLEAAYDQLDRFLGLRPRRPLTVVVHDGSDFDARFAGLFRFSAAGFYGDAIHIRGDVAMTQPLVRVLHHELVHAAFDAAAPSFVLPAWLNEGLAEWFEARAVGKRRLSPGELGALARAARENRLYSFAELSTPAFGHLSSGDAGLAYLQSYGFVEFLARRHGERRLRDFVDQLLRSRDLERSLQHAYRDGLARLTRQFTAELRGA